MAEEKLPRVEHSNYRASANEQSRVIVTWRLSDIVRMARVVYLDGTVILLLERRECYDRMDGTPVWEAIGSDTPLYQRLINAGLSLLSHLPVETKE
jgi:hypothetical protein